MPLQKIDNFLSEDLFNLTFEAAEEFLKHGDNVFSTNFTWGEGVRKDSFPVLCHNICKQSDIYTLLREEIEKKTGMIPYNSHILIYYWTRFSYIPWHQDTKIIDGVSKQYDGALTVYLNKNWDRDFGGYLLYEDGEEIKAVLPKTNLGIFQIGTVQHSTTPVNFDGRVKITLQVFLKKPNLHITFNKKEGVENGK